MRTTAPRFTSGLGAIMVTALALVACGEGRAQPTVTPFQVSSLRPPPDIPPPYGYALETEPDIAGHGDSLVAVWSDLGDGGDCYNRLGWATSVDAGTTWAFGGRSPDIGAQMPSICASASGGFYVARTVCNPYKDIAVQRGSFTSSGLTWGPAVLAVTVPDICETEWPNIACDPAGNLYLCYTESKQSPPVFTFSHIIGFVRSTDGGTTWSAPLVLSGSRSSGGRMVVGPDGGVYVIWRDHVQGTVVGRKSVDQGVSFGPEFVVGPVIDTQGALPPGWYPNGGCYPHPLFFD